MSRAWLFGSVRMACTGFFLAAAAFCLWGCADGPLRLRLRAACKGDFAAVQAAVYPTHCRWHQNGEPYRLEHVDLMGAWELPDGFVLQWEGPPLFVHHSDAQAVRYILSRSYGVPYRVLRPRREPFWALCACTAGLAISLWLSGGGLRLLRQSFAPLRTAAGCSAVCRRTGFFQHKRPLLCRRGRRRLVHGGARLRCFAGNDPCFLYRGRPHFGR